MSKVTQLSLKRARVLMSAWKKNLEVVLEVERISPHPWRVFKRKQFLFQI